MQRRTYLRTLGAAATLVPIAGCSSGDDATNGTGENGSSATGAAGGTAGDTASGAPATATPGRTAGEPATASAPPSMGTESATADGAGTTTASTAGTTVGDAPGTNALVPATAFGQGWSYADGSEPEVRSNGVIRATYRKTGGYARTVRTLLWPCRGETLSALGGSCTLGQLPDQQRANDSVETANLSIGNTSFQWWAGAATDLEVVENGYVFRMTHTPLDPSSGAVPGRQRRIDELHRLAREQTERLAGLASGSE